MRPRIGGWLAGVTAVLAACAVPSPFQSPPARPPASQPHSSPALVVTPVPGTGDERDEGVVIVGGLVVRVQEGRVAAEPAFGSQAATTVVMEAFAAGDFPVLGIHDDSPSLHPVAAEFVTAIEQVLGPAMETGFAPETAVDAWIVVAEGEGTDGRYIGVGVVGQDGQLLGLYVISPGIG